MPASESRSHSNTNFQAIGRDELPRSIDSFTGCLTTKFESRPVVTITVAESGGSPLARVSSAHGACTVECDSANESGLFDAEPDR